MRSTLRSSVAILSLFAGLSACRDANANSASADLKRDLDLAATATINLAVPRVDSALLTLEGQPQSAPKTAAVVRRGAGNRAVRSNTPTVRAEPVTELAAAEESEVVETVAEAPAPEIDEPVAVAPRPTPVVIPVGGSGDYGNGGGIFGGGVGGVVIRGGGVDGDNCELHRRGRTGSGGIYRIPTVHVPTAGGSIIPVSTRGTGSIGIGGMSGARRSGSVSRAPRTSSGSQSVSRPSIGRRGR